MIPDIWSDDRRLHRDAHGGAPRRSSPHANIVAKILAVLTIIAAMICSDDLFVRGVNSGLFPVAYAQSPMKIVEEAGAWKVIIGGPSGIYVVAQTDRAALGVVPADDGLYLCVNVPDTGLETVAVLFDNGANYVLAVQIAAGAPTYRTLIDANQSVSFVHALTAGKTAKIVAGSNTYPVSLAGTSPAIDALNFYGKEHDLHLPPPFTPAKAFGAAPTDTKAALPPVAQTVPAKTPARPAGEVSVLNANFTGSYEKPTDLTVMALSEFAMTIRSEEYSAGRLKVSFGGKVTNGSKDRWKARLCVRFYDNDNLEIESSTGGTVNIGPVQSDISDGNELIERKLWAQVVTIKAYAARFGCSDSPGEAISPVLTLHRQD